MAAETQWLRLKEEGRPAAAGRHGPGRHITRAATRRVASTVARRSPMTRHGRALERRRQRPPRGPRREPADQEPGVEGVAGPGGVGRGDMFRGDLEAGDVVADTCQDGLAVGPRLTTAAAANSSKPSTDRPSRSAAASLAVANNRLRGGFRDECPRRALAVGQQRSDRRQVDADKSTCLACKLDSAPPGVPERLAEQRVDRKVERIRPLNQAARRSTGRRWSAAPRSATKLRSPSAPTRTPIRPVRAPGTRTTRGVTPSPRSVSTRTRPVASRPTAVIRLSALRAGRAIGLCSLLTRPAPARCGPGHPFPIRGHAPERPPRPASDRPAPRSSPTPVRYSGAGVRAAPVARAGPAAGAFSGGWVG